MTLARTLGEWPGESPRGAVHLAAMPMDRVWMVYAVVLALAAGLLAWGLWRARLRGPATVAGDRGDGGPASGRAWLEATALVGVAMLLVSPIVWTFYFVWLLPACLCLLDRPRVLGAIGIVMWAGLAVTPARGLGLHLACALVLAAFVVLRPATGGDEAGPVAAPAAT